MSVPSINPGSELTYRAALQIRGAHVDLNHDRRKYRKMRIAFERKMRESDELFKSEQKALATIKRLNEENEYVMKLNLTSRAILTDGPIVSYASFCWIITSWRLSSLAIWLISRSGILIPSPRNPPEQRITITYRHRRRKILIRKTRTRRMTRPRSSNLLPRSSVLELAMHGLSISWNCSTVTRSCPRSLLRSCMCLTRDQRRSQKWWTTSARVLIQRHI